MLAESKRRCFLQVHAEYSRYVSQMNTMMPTQQGTWALLFKVISFRIEIISNSDSFKMHSSFIFALVQLQLDNIPEVSSVYHVEAAAH